MFWYRSVTASAFVECDAEDEQTSKEFTESETLQMETLKLLIESQQPQLS